MNEITAVKGQLLHNKSGKKVGFGAMASRAAQLEVPEEVVLKDPTDFTISLLPRRFKLGPLTISIFFIFFLLFKMLA